MKYVKQNKARKGCSIEMKCFFGAHKKCSTKKHSRYAKGSGLELLHGFKSGPNFNSEGTYQVYESTQTKNI